MPAYSERVSSHQSLIYSEIKYVYSEYSVLMNTFCCINPFTINGIDCTYMRPVYFEVLSHHFLQLVRYDVFGNLRFSKSHHESHPKLNFFNSKCFDIIDPATHRFGEVESLILHPHSAALENLRSFYL
jgi:hypothetical protein